MGQSCKTCQHPSLLEIHRLRAGETPLQAISDAFGLTIGTLHRHLKHAQVEGHPCRARFEAVACGGGAGQVAASDRPTPALALPMRRRAIAGAGRTLQPVALGPDNDPGGPAAAPIMPFHAAPAALLVQPHKSPLPTNPQELALLQAIGYNAEQIVDLLGGGASAVAEFIEESHGTKRSLGSVTRPQWAYQCIRFRVDYLFSLRRQQQAAMDDRQHRVARLYNADIDRAMTQLFKTLETFGLVGPIDPSEISKEGDDVRGMLQVTLDILNGKLPTDVTPEELQFLEEDQRAIA